MYSTCIFCHTGLGSNESIEHFPVGRRLAFDAAKGRLWVVCRSCERWNLTPLEERWEAIEECERLFRDTKLRVSTDNIGLARLKEGTTLVRVGEPQRPEMAAWRYGDQFNRRRRKYYALVGGGIVAIGGIAVGGAMAGVIGFSSINLLMQLSRLPRYRTAVRLPVNGTILRISQAMVDATRMMPNNSDGFELRIQHKPLSMTWMRDGERRVVLSGDDAIRAARHLLPRINRAGGTAADVTAAVRLLEDSGNTDRLFASTASRYATVQSISRRAGGWLNKKNDGTAVIGEMSVPVRLALEMSLHEDDERRALEGELSVLEDRWREAEEVATISDDMFLPAGIASALDRLKRG